MPGIIVSDTSYLILFGKIGRTELLRSLFGSVTITQTIADEFGKVLPDFIQIENPVNLNYQRILENLLDPGEASAIALAIEKDDCLLILDDYKGRREAKHLGLEYTGTIGIIITAKEKGLINSVTGILEKIKQTNFQISEKIIADAIKKSGE